MEKRSRSWWACCLAIVLGTQVPIHVSAQSDVPASSKEQALANCKAYIPVAESIYGEVGHWSCYLGNPVSYFLGEDVWGNLGFWFPSFSFTATPAKIVVIDPGHGFSCRVQGLPPGAVGATDFPASNPPAGRLQEDGVAFAIASQVQQQMNAAKFRVILTKSSSNGCPQYKERARIANAAKAKVFVAVHANAPLTALGFDVPFAHGTSALYNSAKPASSKLADDIARQVSGNLGLNNRGAAADDSLAVLRLTRMNGVLLEAGRLSGRDEEVLHMSDAASRAAGGIKTALEQFLADK